jgi:hypothetical protein
VVDLTVRRERRWASAGQTPARELVRSTADPIAIGWGDPFNSGFRGTPQGLDDDNYRARFLPSSVSSASRSALRSIRLLTTVDVQAHNYYV